MASEQSSGFVRQSQNPLCGCGFVIVNGDARDPAWLFLDAESNEKAGQRSSRTGGDDDAFGRDFARRALVDKLESGANVPQGAYRSRTARREKGGLPSALFRFPGESRYSFRGGGGVIHEMHSRAEKLVEQYVAIVLIEFIRPFYQAGQNQFTT